MKTELQEIQVLAGVGRRYPSVTEAREARVFLDEGKAPPTKPPLAKGKGGKEPPLKGKKKAPPASPGEIAPAAKGGKGGKRSFVKKTSRTKHEDTRELDERGVKEV